MTHARVPATPAVEVPRGRVIVKCPTCGAMVCTISEEAVKRAMKLAGWSLMPVHTALTSTLTLAAMRCLVCEQRGGVR